MTIKECHDWLEFILKKTRSGFFSHETLDDSLHWAQLGVFATYFSEFMQTQYVHEAIRPFRRQAVSSTTATGFLVYPSGYQHATGSMASYYDNTLQQNFIAPLKIYKDDELPDALSSQVRKVTNQAPIGHLTNTGLQVYPKSAVYTITLFYLATPTKPLYSYTKSDATETHDPLTSTDLEWADTYIMPVLMKALEYLGLNIQRPEVVQYANEKTAQIVTTPIKS